MVEKKFSTVETGNFYGRNWNFEINMI